MHGIKSSNDIIIQIIILQTIPTTTTTTTPLIALQPSITQINCCIVSKTAVRSNV
jgi:hypothetical protein